MSASKKTQDIDGMRRIEDALIESFIAAKPDEIREHIKEAGGDFDAYVILANKMIAEAEEMCAKARLDEAKAAAASFRASTANVSAIPFNREKAKVKLEAMKSRDPALPMMLAARKGNGLSDRDEDALLRALADLEKLESEDETE